MDPLCQSLGYVRVALGALLHDAFRIDLRVDRTGALSLVTDHLAKVVPSRLCHPPSQGFEGILPREHLANREPIDEEVPVPFD